VSDSVHAAGTTGPRRPGRPATGFPIRRREIVEVAMRLFAEHGYQNTTVAQICEAADLTKGVLYHYVKSKEELLAAVFDSYTIPTLEAFEALMSGEPPFADQLREASRLMVRTITTNLDAVRIVERELPLLRSDDPQWSDSRQRMRRIDQMVRTLISDGIEAGEFAPMDPALGAMAFWGMHNNISRWYGPKWEGRLDDISDTFMRVLTHGFGVEG
jgi:AcrR family transcriptional regulator